MNEISEVELKEIFEKINTFKSQRNWKEMVELIDENITRIYPGKSLVEFSTKIDEIVYLEQHKNDEVKPKLALPIRVKLLQEQNIALFQLKDYKRLIENCDRCLQLSPNVASHMLNKAYFYHLKGEINTARQITKDAYPFIWSYVDFDFWIRLNIEYFMATNQFEVAELYISLFKLRKEFLCDNLTTHAFDEFVQRFKNRSGRNIEFKDKKTTIGTLKVSNLPYLITSEKMQFLANLYFNFLHIKGNSIDYKKDLKDLRDTIFNLDPNSRLVDQIEFAFNNKDERLLADDVLNFSFQITKDFNVLSKSKYAECNITTNPNYCFFDKDYNIVQLYYYDKEWTEEFKRDISSNKGEKDTIKFTTETIKDKGIEIEKISVDLETGENMSGYIMHVNEEMNLCIFTQSENNLEENILHIFETFKTWNPTNYILQFKYSKNAYDNNIFKKNTGKTFCECCGQIPEYIYDGKFYSQKNVHTFCPFCIKSGEVSRVFQGAFQNFSTKEIEKNKLDELLYNTPSYNPTKSEKWVVHCNDICSFVREIIDMKNIESEVLESIKTTYKETNINATSFEELADGIGITKRAYLFQCLSCKKYFIVIDNE